MSFLTANGSRDSHAITLADGNHNGSRKAGTPYQTITWGGIRRLMDAPTAVEKDDAPFVILSTYNDHDGRSFDAQRVRGIYGGLAVDIDEGDPSIEEVISAVQAVVGAVGLEVYSSSSAAADNRKWRVLIPLAAPLAGSEYVEHQEALFSLLGKHGLHCDSALARTGQAIYLPNVPEGRRDDHGRPLFYVCRHVDGPALELGPKSAIVDAVEHNREQHARLKAEAAEAAEERAAKRSRYAPAGDDTSPIDQFNENHDIGSLLLRYGFDRREGGQRDHYRHPGLGNSGSYSMEDMGGHWVCMSDWAKGCKLGGTSRSGFQFGDAFDLFAYFEHGNDRKAAVRAYGAELRERLQGAAVKATPPTSPRPATADELAGVGVMPTADNTAAGAAAPYDNGVITFDQCVEEYLAALDDAVLPTGFRPFDDATDGGLPVGELTGLCAPPGAGKSALALQLVIGAMIHDAGLRALWCLGEMTPRILVRRAACVGTAILGDGVLTMKDTKRRTAEARAAAESMRELVGGGRLSVLKPVLTVSRIAEAITATQARLVVIDYLQLMTGAGHDRIGEMEDRVAQLTALANTTETAIVVVSSMSKAAIGNGAKIGTIGKGSGQIDYAMSFVFLGEPDEEAIKAKDTIYDVKWHCTKSRNEARHDFLSRFDGSRQFYTQAVEEYEEFATFGINGGRS
jgi:KaiC/GvpD/RAD55 family RecA-like ATPase